VRKEDLWVLINATSRLRLTAYTLAGLRTQAPVEEGDFGGACLPLPGSGEYAGAPACVGLRSVTARLAGFYDAIADEIGHPRPGPLKLVPAPDAIGAAVPRREPPYPGASQAKGPAPAARAGPPTSSRRRSNSRTRTCSGSRSTCTT
jgi:hypothetical protein